MLKTFFAVYICISGSTCPQTPIIGKEEYYSQQTCENDARLIAQGMYVATKDKYGYKCEPVDYEPPNLK